VLRVKLKYIETWNEQRRERAATYERLFAEAGLSGAGDSPVMLPQTAEYAHHVFHQYVIRARRRDELRAFLAQQGIATEIYYPIPLHLQPCFAFLEYRDGDLPEAERASREVLALPMFSELTESEQRWVVETIADFYS
jgi:dTDP-4-amino-4,6-dideoxygalactose transaminase